MRLGMRRIVLAAQARSRERRGTLLPELPQGNDRECGGGSVRAKGADTKGCKFRAVRHGGKTLNEAAIISLAGVIGQLVVAGFFFGQIRQSVANLSERSDRGDRRVDSIELRLNDHTERIARLEGPREEK